MVFQSTLSEWFFPTIVFMATKIHATAIIDPGAVLDDTVEVQPYTIIGPHVHIGAGTVVGPHCVIEGRTRIGSNNRIFSGAQIGVLSQDLKHDMQFVGRCEIGDNNVLREHITISASTMSSFEDEHRVTSIDDNCLLMAYCHVAHDCRVGSNVIMANAATLSGHVIVEDKVVLGGLSAIHQFCTVGTMAMIGGCSALTKDVPPYMLVDGNPAKCAGPNTVGLRRNGLDEATRRRIKTMYKIIFRSDLNTTQALHEIEAAVPECPERERFVDFIRKSIRGITR